MKRNLLGLLYTLVIGIPLAAWLQPPWWATFSFGLLVAVLVNTWLHIICRPES